uniref:Uncharacterized protein n=1 Tax=Plectus sambesii TaxID=2011161 RepID=A0A914V965_9BILA
MVDNWLLLEAIVQTLALDKQPLDNRRRRGRADSPKDSSSPPLRPRSSQSTPTPAQPVRRSRAALAGLLLAPLRPTAFCPSDRSPPPSHRPTPHAEKRQCLAG